MEITPEEPWFDNPCRPNSRIYWYHCMPHLIKLMRNHFFKDGYVLKCGTKVGKEHLKEVAEKMYAQGNELLPSNKLTDKHLNPPDEQKVSYATQLFSQTNSDCIERLFPNNDTMQKLSKFFSDVNNLFDIFNAHVKSHKNNPYGDAYGWNKDITKAQNDFLKEMKKEISTLRARWANKGGKKLSRQPWQDGMLMNITALKPMYEELKKEYPGQIDYILTYRLNQDCLEQFFSVLRAMGGSYTKFGALEGLRRIRSNILGAGGTLVVDKANVKATEQSEIPLESLVEKADFTIPEVVDPDLELEPTPNDEVLFELNLDVVPLTEHENPSLNTEIDFEKLLEDYESSKNICFRGSGEPEVESSDEEDLDEEEIVADVTNILEEFGVTKEIKVTQPQQECLDKLASELEEQHFLKFLHDTDFRAMEISREQLIDDLKLMEHEFLIFHSNAPDKFFKGRGVTTKLVSKLKLLFNHYDEKLIKKFVLERTYMKIRAVYQKNREERREKLAENRENRLKSIRSKTKAMEYDQANNFAPKALDSDSDPDYEEATSSRKRTKKKRQTGQSVKRSKK